MNSVQIFILVWVGILIGADTAWGETFRLEDKGRTDSEKTARETEESALDRKSVGTATLLALLPVPGLAPYYAENKGAAIASAIVGAGGAMTGILVTLNAGSLENCRPRDGVELCGFGNALIGVGIFAASLLASKVIDIIGGPVHLNSKKARRKRNLKTTLDFG